MSVFGDNLKRIRIQKGMSQEYLASLMGYKGGKATISRIENGHNGVNQATVLRFCEVLNVSPIDLLKKNNNILILSTHEQEVIKAYRNHPEFQSAIDSMLKVEKKSGDCGIKIS